MTQLLLTSGEDALPIPSLEDLGTWGGAPALLNLPPLDLGEEKEPVEPGDAQLPLLDTPLPDVAEIYDAVPGRGPGIIEVLSPTSPPTNLLAEEVEVLEPAPAPQSPDRFPRAILFAAGVLVTALAAAAALSVGGRPQE